MRSRTFVLLAAFAALSVTLPAYADGLIGSQVTFTLNDPSPYAAISVPLTATVGPGVEFPTGSVVSNSSTYTVYNPNIDVSAESILISYTVSGMFNGASFNGFSFDFAGAPTITGVSLDPASTLAASEVLLGFSGDRIEVNLQGDSVTPSTNILLDVTTPATVAPTPEPRSFVLLATGLFGIAVLVQRKKLTAYSTFS
jgi:hypothetical protein